MARPSITTTDTRAYTPIRSRPLATPARELPVVGDCITIAPSPSVSSTPKNPIATILSSKTPNFNWIENRAIHYPFPIPDDSNEEIDVIEYQTTGTLKASFLSADAKSHIVKVTVDDRDI